ncbi:MAG: phytoene/squalene synthase family protein [Betaproteobacteria bacterium]|nr:phytoene/squalene synthase family protein [Betaproteobacteria bacterium]
MSANSSTELSQHDLQACVALMRGGSKTFFAASRLLPPRVRAGAIALYAFCRVADDLVDQGGDGPQAIAQLRQRLDAIYAGTPHDVIEDHALCLLIQQTALPRALLDALVEGFKWDVEQRRYETLEEVHAYAARVAGTVGAMMCWIMGPRGAATIARACELGTAMQLTNIARDVGEDARNKRLYLPRQWLREGGIDPDAWLEDPSASPQLRSVVGRLLDEADRLYRRASCGIAELPPDCRAAIHAASLIYAEIGHQLRRDGLNSVDVRTVVGTPRKLVLLAGAWTQAHWIFADPLPSEPLPAIAYLVEACEAQTQAMDTQRKDDAPDLRAFFPNRAMPQRIEWMLDLFERREAARRDWHAARRRGAFR